MSDLLPPLVVVVPFAAAGLAFLAGGRISTAIGLAGSLGTGALALILALRVAVDGTQRHILGGWSPPLGIELAADPLSAAMILTTTVVGLPVSLFAMGSAATATGRRPGAPGPPGGESRPVRGQAAGAGADAGHERGSAPGDHAVEPAAFWPRWLFLWGSLNALFLARDVFNVYITLELVTLAAVGLVLLSNERAALVAGLRYLLVAFFGSVAYLLGVGMVYGATGTLAFDQVAARLPEAPVVPAVAALMTAGLAVKSALLPFHAWLPPAHSRAPAPASAVLSGLVVMAGLYLLVRLWIEVFPAAIPGGAGILGVAGVAALAYGSVRAVMAPRLKLLLAWSTVAQVGLIVLAIPAGLAALEGLEAVRAGAAAAAGAAAGTAAAAGGIGAGAEGMSVMAAAGGIGAAGDARAGMALLAGSHALAKASLFLVAGLVANTVGHDRLRELGAPWRRMPLASLAVVLAGASLLGIPGTGGEAGKHLLADLARDGGAWWWGAAIDGSSLLTATYLAVLAWAMAVPHRGPAASAARGDHEAAGAGDAGASSASRGGPSADRGAPSRSGSSAGRGGSSTGRGGSSTGRGGPSTGRGAPGNAPSIPLQLIPLVLAALTLVAGWLAQPILHVLRSGGVG
jgi:multicomponent Na+:H+ antiporter subunit D